MSEFDLMNVLATWVIWPAFSASVILDRQSVAEMQPAAATGTTDTVATSAAPTTMETAPRRRVRFVRPREWNIVLMDVLLPRWCRNAAVGSILIKVLLSCHRIGKSPLGATLLDGRDWGPGPTRLVAL